MKYILKIFSTTKELKKYYIGIGALTVVISLSQLLMPYLMGLAIDEIGKGTGADLGRAIWFAVGILSIDLFNNIANNISDYYGDIMGERLRQILSERYYKHLLKLPQSYFDNELSGKIINRLERSVAQLKQFATAVSNNFLQFVFTTFFALIVVALYSWQVAALLASLYPIYIYLTVRTSSKWLKYQDQKNEEHDIALGRFAEAVTQIDVVKSFAQEQRELSFFRKHFRRTVELTKPQSRHWHVSDFKRRLALNFIFFGVFLTIFIQGVNGTLTPGQAVALILYSNQIRIPIFTISFLVDLTQHAIGNSKDYFQALEAEEEEQAEQRGKQLAIHEAQVTFDDVRFGYEEEDVLRGINFTIESGTKVALVGQSGGGKTTIANLLMGFYRPTSGKITIDGTDISSISTASLRDASAAVFQNPSLFSGTIAENITYSTSKTDTKAMVEAAKAANAYDFINDFPDGFESEIGEKGLKLSGGQKQRIAIARAIYKDAPILILDEATSSLDSKSEIEVQAALESLMHERTTLIIAHRLSTIQHVDKIVVLEQGKVAQFGSPAELAQKPGLYRELLALQKGDRSAQERLRDYDITA